MCNTHNNTVTENSNFSELFWSNVTPSPVTQNIPPGKIYSMHGLTCVLSAVSVETRRLREGVAAHTTRIRSGSCVCPFVASQAAGVAERCAALRERAAEGFVATVDALVDGEVTVGGKGRVALTAHKLLDTWLVAHVHKVAVPR